MSTDDTLTSGEAKFLDQYTRKLMVQWCHEALVSDSPPKIPPEYKVYRDYAITKKWLSSKDGSILSAGWATAAAFLKR
jgi:hypothetical protein